MVPADELAKALAAGGLPVIEVTFRTDAADANQILGGIAYAEGNAEEAEQAFRTALESAPGRSSIYSDLGLALAVQGKAADAIA